MTRWADKTDEDLAATYKSNQDRHALGELYRRNSLMCLAICHKYFKDTQVAEDAAMNIFEKLFRDLQVHEVKNFRSWFHSVIRNYCLMQLRKPVRELRMSDSEEQGENKFVNLSWFLHPDEREEDKENRLQQLEKALSQLKQQQKECIELFYLKQKSYEEIGKIKGFTSNEVKSHIQNGKRNLKIFLEGKETMIWLLILLWIPGA